MTLPASPPARPNLVGGVLAAAAGALVGAVAWAVLVSATDYKIGFAAVGVGALAGIAAGKVGGGAPQLPVIAAVIGLIGCVIGDVFTDAHAVAKIASQGGSAISSFHVLRTMLEHPSDFGWPVYKAGFEALDVLFYGFAAVAAFRLATAHGLAHRPPASFPPPTAPPTTPPATTPPPPSEGTPPE
jgi:hypothetical protein